MKKITISLIVLCCLFSNRADSQISYNSQYIVNMPNELGELYNFQNSNKIQQSFRLNMDDVNAIGAKIQFLLLNTDNLSPGGDFDQIKINFYEGTIDNLGALIHTQPYTFESIDVEIGFVYPYEGTKIYTISGNLEFDVEKDYVLEIEAPLDYSRPWFGFKTTTSDIGTSNQGDREIWMKLYGNVSSNADTSITISNVDSSNYYLDVFSNFFPDKLLNKFEPENLFINSSLAGLLDYRSSDESIVKVAIKEQEIGVKDKVELMGLEQGRALIYILNENDTISHFNVNVTTKETIDVSYQYIKYPEESDHSFITAYASITDRINSIYRPANVSLNFTNQGVIEYDWDLNEDGESYTPDFNEFYASADIIPDSSNFFSNLFLLRENKNDEYFGGGNGGGSSIGFGQEDSVPRYGFVALHLFRTEENLGETLAHELGHNFGLSHYSSTNTLGIDVPNDFRNFMKVGREDDLIYGFQWDVIHNTINYRKNEGESYDLRIQAQIFDFEDTAIPSTTTDFQLNASTNSDSKIIYKLISGDQVIDLDNDGEIEVLQDGEVEIMAYVYATDNYLASSKKITLTVSPVLKIDELKNKPIVIYPNPNDGIVNLDLKAFQKVSIRIISSNGEMVYRENDIKTTNHSINLKGHSGIYLVEVRSENESQIYKLILK